MTLSRGDAGFDGAVVNLGALGIVSEITLDLCSRPSTSARPSTPTCRSLRFTANFEALAASAYSVSFFTLWADDTIQQSLAQEPHRYTRAHRRSLRRLPATRAWHPIAAIDPAPCHRTDGRPRPWHERLAHFRMEFTPSAGAELQSEYFVARTDAVAAFEALRKIQHLIAPHLLVSEIRTIAADELWLSMNHQRDSVAFHFTFKPDWPNVQQVLPHIEAALAPFDVRPHWGKLFTMPKAEVQSGYSRLADFRALAQQHDPDGKFRNAFVDDYVFDLARNWSGNIVYGARATHSPRSAAELQSIVRAATKLRVIGSRHSFNAIADTDGDLVSLRHLNRVARDRQRSRTVTVEGGATYRDIAPALDAAGFALANLASLPHITIVGACATGTHGSGNTNPGLAAAVAALTFIAADGERVHLERGDPGFDGAPVHLGALGPIVDITLDLVPRYEARQEVFLDLPFASLVGNFDAITASAYSVSIFSRWLGDSVGQIWLKSLGDAPPLPRDLFGARPTDYPVPLIPKPDAPPSTERLGTNAPWHDRISHYPIDADIPTGAELPDRIFRRPRRCPRCARGPACDPGSLLASAADLRDPHRSRRRQALAQPLLPARQRRPAFRLAPRLARRQPHPPGDRSRPRAVRSPRPLGQALHPEPRRCAVRLPPSRRLPRPRPEARPARQVPQRLPRRLRLLTRRLRPCRRPIAELSRRHRRLQQPGRSRMVLSYNTKP